MGYILSAIFACAVLGTAMQPAFAGSAIAIETVIHNCQNPRINKQVRISACTQLLHANLVSEKMRGVFHALRAQAYYDAGDEASALTDYNAALKLFPDFPQALVNRGEIEDSKNQIDKALADYTHAAKADPKDYFAQRSLCSLRLRMGDDQGAARACADAIALKPDEAAPRAMHIEALAKLGRCRDASDDLEFVAQHAPDVAQTLQERELCAGPAAQATR